MAATSVCLTSTTLSLVVGIGLLVFVFIGIVSHRCNCSSDTFYNNTCALYDGRATRCSELSEFECDLCSKCRWNIDQNYNGTCIRNYGPKKRVKKRRVIPWWDYSRQWYPSWWTSWITRPPYKLFVRRLESVHNQTLERPSKFLS